MDRLAMWPTHRILPAHGGIGLAGPMGGIKAIGAAAFCCLFIKELLTRPGLGR